MGEADINDRLGLGGNLPPAIVEDVRDQMRQVLDKYAKRKGELLARLQSTVVRDRATAGDAIDRVGIAKDVKKLIDGDRVNITGPLDDAKAAAISMVLNFWADIEEAATAAHKKATDWEDEEEQRIRDQQREQELTEQKLRQAQQPRAAIHYTEPPIETPSVGHNPLGLGKPPRQQLRGDYGYKLVKRGEIKVSIEDITKVPADILMADKVVEAICAVGRDMAKHMKTIPGLKIDRGTKSSVQG